MRRSASVPRRCQPACKLSQEQMPPHYNHTKASALCSELRLLLVSKKGPATLKGLVKFSGSGPPGSLGLLELPKPRARPSLKKSICKGDGSYEDGGDESVLTHYPVSMSIFPPLWHPPIMCFGPVSSFQVGFLFNMASCHFGYF